VKAKKEERYGIRVSITAELHAPVPESGRAGPRRASRIAVLDGLRLLAATMVVFYHYVGVPNAKIGDTGRTDVLAWGTSAPNIFPHALNQAASYGWTGVELFFMISGFVICMSGWGRRPADFFVSRVVRLVPAYWAATLLTAAVLMIFPRLTSGVRPSVVLTNLTMVQSAYGVPNLVPAYWTLFVELTFYLLFGLVAIGGITYRRMVTFCVLWSVASLVAAGSHHELLNNFINPPYSPFFVAGIAFFLIHKFGGNLLLWAIVGYSWLISVNQPHTNPPWQVVVILTAFYVIMAVVATHRLDGIQWRWLPIAGALTYPLYLVHQDIGFTAFAYLKNLAPAWVIAVAVYAGMLGIAWLIYRGVERPLAPVLKRKLTAAVESVRRSGRPQAAAAAVAGLGLAGPGAAPANGNGHAANGNGHAASGTGHAAGPANGTSHAAGPANGNGNAAAAASGNGRSAAGTNGSDRAAGSAVRNGNGRASNGHETSGTGNGNGRREPVYLGSVAAPEPQRGPIRDG
jgi:peptidoglycan/LPS O-acetylase OafA/YrhL